MRAFKSIAFHVEGVPQRLAQPSQLEQRTRHIFWRYSQWNNADAYAQDSANHLGDIRQNQQQRRGEENESGLANFRMFEHG
jgi:hypothetical protein